MCSEQRVEEFSGQFYATAVLPIMAFVPAHMSVKMQTMSSDLYESSFDLLDSRNGLGDPSGAHGPDFERAVGLRAETLSTLKS